VWAQGAPAAPSESSQEKTFPVTTSSAAAVRYFETGMVHYENHRWNFALRDWHEALQLDPKLALAYVWICFTTTNPAEESQSRAKAKALMNEVSPAEQLQIRWMAGVHENNYVDGIQAMNDLAGMFPHDKRLHFLIGYWLYKQDEYERSKTFTLKALAEDANYATGYNQLGYLYSRSGDYGNALEAMSKYVKLLPDEPNPHDSYGEILRLSGHFQEALDQYRVALKIDPTFYISQKELGETYAVMGEGEKAREEYAKAIHDAPSSGLKAEYMQKSAMTYLREKKYAEADKAYNQAADNAHALEQWIWEARGHRIMAMYQPDNAIALKELNRAEELLSERSDVVAKVDLAEEHARILRVAVERAVLINDLTKASRLLADLEKMAIAGSSVSIQRTYSGARGTLLVAQKKYREAVPVLEEDFMNPLSIRQLVTAYRKTRATAQAEALRKRLLDWKIPTVEEALAVPAFRAQEGMLSAK